MRFLCSLLFQLSSLHALIEGISLDSRTAYYEAFFNVYLYKPIFCLFLSQACRYKETPNYVMMPKHEENTEEFTVAFYLESPKGN